MKSSGYRISDITEKQRERFWSFVTKSEGCWEWSGGVHGKSGYGQISVGSRTNGSHRSMPAHRVAWAICNNSDLPKELVIRHSCDYRKCVNPAHLQLGTYAENTADAISRARHPVADRHGMSKLDWDDVRLIRKLHRGLTIEELSRSFGISHTQTKRICNYESWTQDGN